MKCILFLNGIALIDFAKSSSPAKHLHIKMLKKFLVFNFAVGILLADPVVKLSQPLSAFNVDHKIDQDTLETVLPLHRNHETSLAKKALIDDVARTVFGYRNSALNLAVDAIEWMVSQSPSVILGTVVTILVCRLTGSCDVDYQDYIPAEITDYMTPDRMAKSQEFAINAIEKYLSSSDDQFLKK